MSKVMRYTSGYRDNYCDGGFEDCMECENGDLVSYKDYAALEQKHTDMAVQLANAESKCRELAAAENNLIDSECHVAELEESLRDKQALLEVLDNSLCELLPGNQYMDPPDGGSVTPLEQVRRMVADYRNRIAELEARTVTLPDEPFYPDGDIDCPLSVNLVDIKTACDEAGVPLVVRCGK